jgi:hypothetical protein
VRTPDGASGPRREKRGGFEAGAREDVRCRDGIEHAPVAGDLAFWDLSRVLALQLPAAAAAAGAAAAEGGFARAACIRELIFGMGTRENGRKRLERGRLICDFSWKRARTKSKKKKTL